MRNGHKFTVPGTANLLPFVCVRARTLNIDVSMFFNALPRQNYEFQTDAGNAASKWLKEIVSESQIDGGNAKW